MTQKPTSSDMTRFVEAIRMFAEALPGPKAIREEDRVALALSLRSGLSAREAVDHLRGRLTFH